MKQQAQLPEARIRSHPVGSVPGSCRGRSPRSWADGLRPLLAVLLLALRLLHAHLDPGRLMDQVHRGRDLVFASRRCGVGSP